MFIAIEGVEGAGKTSILDMLREYIPSIIDKPVYFTREPGGTDFSEALRDILLGWTGSPIDVMSELLLVQSARVQHYNKFIRPKLEDGIVVTDRFMGSTVAYQCYGRGVSLYVLEKIYYLTLGDVHPHVTVYLDCSPETGFKRKINDKLDRIEQESIDFFKRVRRGFLQSARTYPGWFVVDAEQFKDAVSAQVQNIIHEQMGKKYGFR